MQQIANNAQYIMLIAIFVKKRIMLWTLMSDPAILEELGRRLKEIRLRKNIQQNELAVNSGVALGTLQRMEAGKNTSMENFIKLLRGLGLLENLEQVFPEQPISPILLKKLQGKKRKRATGIL